MSNMLNNILAVATVSFLVMASFDESLTAEAIVRLDGESASDYVVNRRNYPAIVMMNNKHSDCPNGKAQCRLKYKATQGINKGLKKLSQWHVSCTATMISRKHAVTARHCFCHKGKDVSYNAGFHIWIAGSKHKVRRTWVPSECGWNCKNPHLTRTPRINQCDIAIIELESKVKSKKVQPYPIYDPAKHGAETGKVMEFYGWGVSRTAGRVTPRVCKYGKQDKKFRRARNVIVGMGKTGSAWQAHKNHLLRIKMVKTKRLRLQGMPASGDGGIPAFIYVKGKPYLAGIHAHAQQNAHNLLKPCSYGSVDEFVRVAAFSKWIHHVLTKSTLMFDRTALRKSSYEDLMPKKKPGSAQWPWHHQFAHRRRRNMSRKGSTARLNKALPRAVPGIIHKLHYVKSANGYNTHGKEALAVPLPLASIQNTCRGQVKRLVRPFLRNVELQFCGATKTLQYPYEFTQPGFAKKISAVIRTQNRNVNGRPRAPRVGWGKWSKGKSKVSTIMKKMLNTMLVQMYHKLYRTINKTNKLYKKDIPNMLAKIELVRKRMDRRYRTAARRKLRNWKKDHPARIAGAVPTSTAASLAGIAMPATLVQAKDAEDAWQQQ